MTPLATPRFRWAVVVLFAIGMAWVESACVYYLRVLVDRVQPYQHNPLPIAGALGGIELIREASTLVMLLAVGALAGRTLRERLGYLAIAFGMWDVFYYVFLRMMDVWPASIFDWDILFLLPLPWWGPVIAPVGIAVLMIIGGTIETQAAAPATIATRGLWRWSAVGIALGLYVFMEDALRAIAAGVDPATILPQAFNWPLYLLALALMALPVAGEINLRLTPSKTPREAEPTAPLAAR